MGLLLGESVKSGGISPSSSSSSSFCPGSALFRAGESNSDFVRILDRWMDGNQVEWSVNSFLYKWMENWGWTGY